MGGEGAANEEKELEVLLRRLTQFFKAINYVRIVERDRQFAHGRSDVCSVLVQTVLSAPWPSVPPARFFSPDSAALPVVGCAVCDLGVFPSLQLLEVQGLPLSCLRGLPILRAQLKVLKVQASTLTPPHVPISSCFVKQ